MQKNKHKGQLGVANNLENGFSLAEVVISVLLVGVVLGMIMGAVTMLDRAVANERVVQFAPPLTNGAANQSVNLYQNWGYYEANGTSWQPNFTTAPSRSADAQADSLWRAVHEIYEQSSAVTALPVYILYDLSDTASPKYFTGERGMLSGTWLVGSPPVSTEFPPLNYRQLTTPGTEADAGQPAAASMVSILSTRFLKDSRSPFTFWGDVRGASGDSTYHPLPSGIDVASYRAATVFFLAPGDRILGILRMRSWQFTDTSNYTTPYRYYEVGLTRPQWTPTPRNLSNLSDLSLPKWNFNKLPPEDYSYRFVEDKKYPQDLVFPATASDLGLNNVTPVPVWTALNNSNARNVFVRFAKKGEGYNSSTGSWNDLSANNNAGVSRQQVSLLVSDNSTALTAGADQWHLILPDPALGQAEERARLRSNGAILTSDTLIRRQGKYGCALSVTP